MFPQVFPHPHPHPALFLAPLSVDLSVVVAGLLTVLGFGVAAAVAIATVAAVAFPPAAASHRVCRNVPATILRVTFYCWLLEMPTTPRLIFDANSNLALLLAVNHEIDAPLVVAATFVAAVIVAAVVVAADCHRLVPCCVVLLLIDEQQHDYV